MEEEAIEILTKMLIKEHLEKKDEKLIIIKKEELIRFCIKLIKTIKKYS